MTEYGECVLVDRRGVAGRAIEAEEESMSKWDMHPNGQWSSLQTEMLRIVVHRDLDYPGEWGLTCHEVAVRNARLNSIKLSDAQTEALGLLRARVERLAAELAEIGGT